MCKICSSHIFFLCLNVTGVFAEQSESCVSGTSLSNENGQILLVSTNEINRFFSFLLRDFPKK